VREVERPRPGTVALVVGVAVLFAAFDVLLFLLGSQSTGPAGPAAALVVRLVLDLSLALVFRYPLAVMWAMIAGSLVLIGSELVAPGLLVATPVLTGDPFIPPTVGVVVGTVVQLRNRRSTWVLVGVITLLATRPWDPSWVTVPLGLLYTAVPALAGRYFAARRTLLADLREKAERIEREQQLRAEQARADERARLAAEMHDVVTHRVSLMVLQAGALEVTATDPAVRRAADALRVAGMQALDELRELVGVFGRVPGGASPAVGPPPPRRELRELVDASVAAGIPVELVQHGPDDGVPPAVLRTAHRVLQEALTNVHKHASGAHVQVEVRYGADIVTVSVANTAPPAPPDPALAGSGSGSGLRGLRERVEVIGGVLRAGLRADGGFEVRAKLPVEVR
jgi:signal transduction histidine kinase